VVDDVRPEHARPGVFDAFWRFAVERQAVFHRRAAGEAPPRTSNPVIGRYKFTNVYRAAERTSQALINSVIYRGRQDTPQDMVFRILLFKIFNHSPDSAKEAAEAAELAEAVSGPTDGSGGPFTVGDFLRPLPVRSPGR
jgi:hypothetical protein